jgi:hypothetical protein
MAVGDGSGLPISVCATSATPHGSKLVEETIENMFVEEKPERLIEGKAFDDDGPMNR